MIQVLFIVNFEKDVNSWAMVTQNLACFFFLLPPPALTHTAGRIDKQLDTMEVHKRHVEELWKNALNLAEQLKQVRQHTMSLALFPVLLCQLWGLSVPYSPPSQEVQVPPMEPFKSVVPVKYSERYKSLEEQSYKVCKSSVLHCVMQCNSMINSSDQITL